jgi:hypothetical protein
MVVQSPIKRFGGNKSQEVVYDKNFVEETVMEKMGAERINLFAETALEFGNILEEEMMIQNV